MLTITDFRLEHKLKMCVVLRAIIQYRDGITWNNLSDLTGLAYFNGLGGCTRELLDRKAIDRIKLEDGVTFYPTRMAEDELASLRSDIVNTCEDIQSLLSGDETVPYRNWPDYDEQP